MEGMSRMSLTPEAKTVAKELHRFHTAEKIGRDLHYLVDEGTYLYPMNQSAKNISEFSSLNGGIMSYAELAELVDAGLVQMAFVTGSIYSFRLLQTLHDAVEADFQFASTATMVVDTMNVTASNINVTTLSSDPDALADALMERLVPFLQAHEGLTDIQLQEIHSAIETLGRASDSEEVEDASRRIWTYIERTSAVTGILAALALALPA
jgi:hypothetical protein